MTALVWLRDDLRLADNPALSAASGGPVVVLYVYDDSEAAPRPPQGAAGWWLSRSLKALRDRLNMQGVPLILRRGPALLHVKTVAQAIGATDIHWNRRYEQKGIAIDTALKAALSNAGLRVHSHHANLLHEPWTVLNAAGQNFKVFTPFWRAHQAKGPPRAAMPAPTLVGGKGECDSLAVEALGLEPKNPDWAAGFAAHWQPGESGARAALATFLDDALPRYKAERDQPAKESTSRLSPHLRFGEISPFQIVQATEMASAHYASTDADKAKFLAEIGWREFSWNLLFHSPALATQNLNTAFDAMPWLDDTSALRAWQQGQTGYPLIDAGMRQLWQTGWMHNRVRMIVASFLIKHLMIDWRIGEQWFWDCLVDADAASNPASWQWVAGSGADAAPYYRIFNPILQGEKFDAAGAYIRAFVPEIAALPDAFIHAPWTAPATLLAAAGVTLGKTYPLPIVDHAFARQRAMAAFRSMRSVTEL